MGHGFRLSERTRAARALLLCLLLVLLAMPAGAEEDYDLDFDIPDVEEQGGFEFWGQAELRGTSRFLDEDSAQYRQKYFNKNQENPAHEVQLQLKPELSWESGEVGAYLRPRLTVAWSQMVGGSKAALDEPSETFFNGDKNWAGQILAEEALVHWSPATSVTVEGGKKVLKWGKGYAWNPVSFISRPKDVNDPDQSREGYYMALADFIRSSDGVISTVAFTPVVSMVGENVNEGLADDETTLVGGKLYVLAYDTDLDLMMMVGDEYDTRIGADFATNLAENFAIHGEAALRMGYDKPLISSTGSRTTETINAWSFLLGLRYLTETDTTYLAEYYHNGEGYSPLEMRQYYRLINDGYDAYQNTGSGALLQASNRASFSYNRSTSGRDYLYFRVSQKEPFDILYLTPTLTTIVNLGDGSFSLNPEVAYLITSDLEVRPRMVIPIGPKKTEFGEKINKVNAELRLTYFY